MSFWSRRRGNTEIFLFDTNTDVRPRQQQSTVSIPPSGPSVYPPSAAACSWIRNIRRIPSTGRLALQFRRRACVVILFTIADCNKIYMHRRWIYMRRQLNSCASRAAHAIYIRHTGGAPNFMPRVAFTRASFPALSLLARPFLAARQPSAREPESSLMLFFRTYPKKKKKVSVRANQFAISGDGERGTRSCRARTAIPTIYRPASIYLRKNRRVINFKYRA